VYTYEKKNIDGNIEFVEKEQPITTPAMVTCIAPMNCNHTNASEDYRVYPINSMIAVPEWVPELVDRIIKAIPDAYNFMLPHFNIWGPDGVESTCTLSLSFKTHDSDAFTRFMEVASILIDKDINGYGSYLKVVLNGSRLPPSECSINISAPGVNFMSSNKGRGRSFFEYVRHIIYRYNNYEQMTIGGI
jgi:hypothetical protein